MPEIIVIIPVYNENAEVVNAVIKGLQTYPFSIVIIDDGSEHSVDSY